MAVVYEPRVSVNHMDHWSLIVKEKDRTFFLHWNTSNFVEATMTYA